MAKTIFMRNDKDRNFNWVAPYQVAEVQADDVAEYLAAGFTDVDELEREYRKSLEKETQDNGVANDPEDQSDDIQARIKFLKEHNIKVQANWKEETIIAKSDEAWYGVANDPEEDEDE